MKYFTLLFLSTIFLLPSCSKEAMLKADIRSLETHGYFPLAVGNEWEYEDGTFIRTDEQVILNGKEYFRFVKSKDARLDTIFYRAEGDHIFEKRSGRLEILKFDLKANENDSWSYTEFATSQEEWIALLRNKNAKLETENYEFKNCLEFYYDIAQVADDEHWVFLAKGIGSIARRVSWRFDGLDPALRRINIGGTEVLF